MEMNTTSIEIHEVAKNLAWDRRLDTNDESQKTKQIAPYHTAQ
jgi:hypothetical protein